MKRWKETLTHCGKEYKLVQPRKKWFAVYLTWVEDASGLEGAIHSSLEWTSSAEDLAITPWHTGSQSVVPLLAAYKCKFRGSSQPSRRFYSKLKLANHLTKAPSVYVMHSFVPYVSRMVLVIHHFWESWEDGHSNHFLFCGSDEGAAEKLQKHLPIYVHQLFLPPPSIIAPTWTHPNVHPQKPGQLLRLLCCETWHCCEDYSHRQWGISPPILLTETCQSQRCQPVWFHKQSNDRRNVLFQAAF